MAEGVIINQDNTIIGGHQRYRVLKKLKHKEVNCWVPDRLLSEHEMDELCVRLNRNHGEFDFDVLANEFNVPDLIDWGFKPEELEIILTEDVESEEKGSKKKLKTCPNCGHEY